MALMRLKSSPKLIDCPIWSHWCHQKQIT